MLAVKEVAGRLGVGRDSVVRIKPEELPYTVLPLSGRKNKIRRYEEADVERFKQRNKKGGSR